MGVNTLINLRVYYSLGKDLQSAAESLEVAQQQVGLEGLEAWQKSPASRGRHGGAGKNPTPFNPMKHS